MPLRWHVAALCAVLGGMAALAGRPGLFSVDEGLAIIQARHLAAGTGWHVASAFPAIDPHGATLGFGPGVGNFVPYGKHPLYPLILAGAQWLGGAWVMLAVSILGTVAAAALAASLSRHVMPGMERLVVWAVGLGGPLAFDGLIVFAHSLGAALATLALLAALELRRRGASVGWLPLLVLAVAASVMLRTEALLLLGMWAVVLVVWGASRRQPRTVAAGVATGLAALAGRVADHLWASALGASSGLATGSQRGLADAVHAAPNTLIGPSMGGVNGTTAALVLAAGVLVAVGAWQLRRRRAGSLLLVPWILAFASLAGAFVLDGRSIVIPGLLVTCPPVFAGVVVARRGGLGGEVRPILAATALGFTVLVLATEYRVGGGLEWGGRYLAVGLPLLTVLAVVMLARALRPVAVRQRLILVGCLAAITLLLAGMGVRALRRSHAVSWAVDQAIAARAAATPPGDGGLPVVVTTNDLLVRLGWPLDGSVRWLSIQPGTVSHWEELLNARGVEAVVLARDDGHGSVTLSTARTGGPGQEVGGR